MNIMLIDDDDAVRMMLQDIIEDYNLGDVTDSLNNATELTNELLSRRQTDILIIDMKRNVIEIRYFLRKRCRAVPLNLF